MPDDGDAGQAHAPIDDSAPVHCARSAGRGAWPPPGLRRWSADIVTRGQIALTHALVRPPAATFAQGLTSGGLGPPHVALALDQHARYCAALEAAGLVLLRLPADPDHPDSTFVEDAAILTERFAILTRPGAPSRRGEPATLETALRTFYPSVHAIAPPGTVDGGDVCQADGTFFIGLSGRTNADGARQLTAILESAGYTARIVDIRLDPGLLHLKSGMSSLGNARLVLAPALAAHEEFRDYEVVRVRADEEHAANCLCVNGRVLLPVGAPALADALAALDYLVTALDQSEFRKMDGGLSCLSLRFHRGDSLS